MLWGDRGGGAVIRVRQSGLVRHIRQEDAVSSMLVVLVLQQTLVGAEEQ